MLLIRTPLLASLTGLLALSFAPASAHAKPKKGEASGSVSLSGADADASGEASADGKKDKKAKKDKKEKDRGDEPWITRWRPERNMVELGIFGGVMMPDQRLELFEADLSLPDQGFRKFKRFAPDVGLRFAYLPIRHFGMEIEGAVMPTNTADDQSALMYAARGHLIAQLGLWSITPFVVAGPTGLGVVSDRNAVGNDIDLGFHFGAGMKIYLNRWTMLRLDARDTLTAKRGVADSVGHSIEFLGGLSFTFGRKRTVKPEEPGDRDGDGILDPDDKCIDVPGVPEYDGCPIPDTDKDGILDPDDKCIDEPGVPEYDGCPIPDTDGDGILDPDDKCVDEPGVPEYEGCPIPDTDGDGILDPQDQCVDEPETQNGYEDEDGCPDEVPKEVAKFTGVIEGIYFDSGKASIKPKSKPKLDKAVKVLNDFESIRIEISGHTDSKGNDEFNMSLSEKRAEAVKQYFVDAGVDASRIQTRGAGENEPIGDNKARAGRAKNRRIEFKLLGQ
jgi:OOP family OmpA-OmpF porin